MVVLNPSSTTTAVAILLVTVDGNRHLKPEVLVIANVRLMRDIDVTDRDGGKKRSVPGPCRNALALAHRFVLRVHLK